MILAALTLGTLLAVEGPAAEAPPPRTIQLEGDRLTVRVSGVPLHEVLAGVVEPSKGEIRGSVKEPRDVTADFENVPLPDGLARLLGEQNFALTYRRDGTLRTLTLLGGPQELPPEARIVKPTPAAPQPPAVAPAAMLQRDVPVPQGSKLAQFFGRDSATLQQLLDVTLRQDDAALRLQALRAGMSAIETQEDLRAAALKALSETDDSRLESTFRAVARDRAQEIASQMVSLSRSPEIRARSVKLLRQLTAGGSGGATP